VNILANCTNRTVSKTKKEVEKGFEKNDKNILKMVRESLEIDSRGLAEEEKHIQRSVETEKDSDTLEKSPMGNDDETFCKQERQKPAKM
jgi:hypothetical protein